MDQDAIQLRLIRIAKRVVNRWAWRLASGGRAHGRTQSARSVFRKTGYQSKRYFISPLDTVHGLEADCVSAGNEAIVRFGIDNPRVWWEVQNAMQDEVSLWLYGKPRDRHGRRLSVIKIEYSDTDTPSLKSHEDQVQARIQVERIYKALQEECVRAGRTRSMNFDLCIAVWEEMADRNGGTKGLARPLPRSERGLGKYGLSTEGYSHWQVNRAKRTLRRVAKKALGELA